MESVTNLKLSILVFFCIYFFISGADGYIILPTAWYYIHSLGLSKSFYGAVLAAQSLGFMLFTPVVGKLADKTRRAKLILLVCALVKVAANLVYAIPVSGYFPLVGCFFSGAANAAYGLIYGEIVRYTMKENVSKLFMLADSMFTIGATCGPFFGDMIIFNTNILCWNINDGNSPGVALAIIWSVLLCALILLPSDFGTEEILDEVSLLGESVNPDTLMKSLNPTVWCLFYVNFSSALLVATCSGVTPLLTLELFHLKLIHVKFLFGIGMMFSILVYLAVYITTPQYSERGILVFTLILQIPTMLLLCTYAFLLPNVPLSLSYTLVVFICFGLPQPSFAFAGSLLSKTTPSQHASTIQSFAVVDIFVAALIGRGISGLVFAQTWLIVYSFGLVALWLFGLTWLGFVFYRLPASGKHYRLS